MYTGSIWFPEADRDRKNTLHIFTDKEKERGLNLFLKTNKILWLVYKN